MKCVEQILQGIESQRFFDTHYIIDRIIRDYHDDYLIYGAKHAANEEPTSSFHRQIVQEIAKFKGTLVEHCEGKSCSIAFHGKSSVCGLWKRI